MRINIQLTNKDGRISTEPAEFPEYNPQRLVVKRRSDIQVSLTEQSDKQVTFVVNGDANAEIQVFIGDLDVTALTHRQGDEWHIALDSLPVELPAQLMLVSSTGIPLSEIELSSATAKPIDSSDHRLTLRGNASISLGSRTNLNDQENDANATTGNLNLETEYINGKFKSHFSGVNINVDPNAEEQVNMGSGYLLKNTYGDTSLSIGDVSVNGTSLVLSGFARRGLLAETEKDAWRTSIFNVRTSSVEGWETGISFDDRQTYGMNFQHQLDDETNTTVQLTAVSGNLKSDNADNVGATTNAEQSGDSVGVLLSTSMVGVGIEAQVAGSKFDNDLSDGLGAEQDAAYELTLTKDIYGLASSLGYQRYGANYATIANPNFSGDREGYDLSLGSAWKFLNWSTAFSRTRDNIDELDDAPIVTSDNVGLNISTLIEGWPGITVGYNISEQASSDEPSADDKINNKGYDVSLGISDSIGSLSWSWSSSIGELRDNLDQDNDSDTLNHALNLSSNFDSVNASLNLSHNENKTDKILSADLANISFSMPLLSDAMTLNAQFSAQFNRADDDSTDTEIYGGSARVSWSLQDVVKLVGLDWANPQVSLSWTASRTQDNNDSSQNESSRSVILDFSFGAPYSFDKNWIFDEAGRE